jgi:pyruvate ferredoxin oxidoreductase gamma subunit
LPIFSAADFPMTEIRIHGRGGQGNLVAAYILAQAAFESGKFAQAFPGLGNRRRGRPMTAFVRITGIPIRRDCEVLQPAFLIVQDHTLLHSPRITEGLQPHARILVNWTTPMEPLSVQGHPVLVFPAATLANEFLGLPIPNTALAAALIILTGIAPPEALERAMALRFRGETLERNIALARKAA